MIDAEDEEFKRLECKLALNAGGQLKTEPTFGQLIDRVDLRFEDFLILREALDLIGMEHLTDDEWELGEDARAICDRVLDLDNGPILTDNSTGGTIESSSTTNRGL
jgi:hypothetical protein